MHRLLIVGGGRMGEALLAGLLERQWATPEELAVVELVEARCDELRAAHPGVTITGTVLPSDGAVIAVKPGDVPSACTALAATGVRRVLSIAAGVTTSRLEEHLGPGVAVIRSMPNTPALLGLGVSAIAAGESAWADDLDWAEGVLRAVGTVERVEEKLLDAVTGLSGSGPAYVFLFAEALIEAGVLVGLPRPTAHAMVRQLLVGSAAMLDTGTTPEQLRAQVTSPGGTTAAGLRVLEQRAMRAAVIDAVEAAARRSHELGS